MILTSVEALQQRSIPGNLMGPIGGFQGVTESVVDNDAFERHVLPEIAVLLRVATSITRNHAEAEDLVQDTLLRDPDIALDPTRGLASEDRADVCVESEIDPRILDAVNALDEPFRRVVELVDVDGLSYADAALALGVPVGTVMSRLHRARSRIRRRLNRAGFASRRHL